MDQPRASRIWELDALRGVCILFVILVHLLFDLSYFLGVSIHSNPTLKFIQQYGGVVFVLLSGLCATLGRRSFRRGAAVFGCGMLVTLVTWAMVPLGMGDDSVVVRFGVLHLLGICMMVWPLFKKLPTWALAVLGGILVVLGYWFEGWTVDVGWLFPFGLKTAAFQSGDYWPLFPQLGWFLLGAVLGRTVYREKRTLLPRFPSEAAPVRFLRWCGRKSLWIYLVHQPLLYGLTALLGILSCTGT